MKGLLSRQKMQGYVQVVVSGTGVGDYEQSRDMLAGGQKWNVSDFNTKKSVIKAGLGWGGMPEHLIEPELKTGELSGPERGWISSPPHRDFCDPSMRYTNGARDR